MKAIETMYAGTLFRSRLEARWAVFFDDLGTAWEFESEGFDVSWRLSRRGDPEEDNTFRYLPDYWLPEHDLFGEVKGSLTNPETERLLNAAASLSGSGRDVLMLGPIPRPGEQRVPWIMHIHKGDLIVLPWAPFATDYRSHLCLAHDVGGTYEQITGENCDNIPGDAIPATLLGGVELQPVFAEAKQWVRRLDSAYSAARSARFEHSHREVWRKASL